MNRHDADSSIDHHTAAIKWRPDMPVAGHASAGDRDRHYVMFRGRWRRVPHLVQRVCDRYGARIFGTMATSTVYGNGCWTGSVR